MAICPNCGEENPDRARLCMMCGTPVRLQRVHSQEARKTVTVLFCDLVGSTALGERLDSESLREVMDRYFTEMKRVVERHGGIVEKYIGDAVMAVFGLPRAHEDDALRAVRAASEMGQSLATLNMELDRYWGVSLANRIGVNTGEVVVGDASSGQRLATGDTVNVAARLEQAALAGTILVGEPTYRLVRDAVEVEGVEPLALKGKSERLPAFRLVEVKREAEGVARRLDAPLVGRESEVAALMDAFQRVVRDNSCHLVAVLGEAGVGKSRLVADIAERLKEDTTILRGRCLSYGDGITFWPVAEIVREAAGISEEDSLEMARQKVAALAGHDKEIAERVEALVGLSDGSYAIEESFWAVRRLFERLAQHQPVVVAIEDIHWAESTFLDLLGHVLDLARAGSILLVCSARKEAFERHSDWLKRLSNASMLELDPLTTEDSETLIHNVLGSRGLDADARDRITQAAQGNPLFVEQMLSMWLDDGTLISRDGQWRLSATLSNVVVPPTISGLLAARLDRLELEERTVIAAASVVGQVFYRGAVQELCPSGLALQVPTKIATLTAKEFIRPDTAPFTNDEAFAFRHVLIRNAAYEAMLKRTRAALHERFASWMVRVTGERVNEYEEIVGYHLEQAYRYRADLGPIDAAVRKLAHEAAKRYQAAGRRSRAVGDMATAAGHFGRALDLLNEDDPQRPELLLARAESLLNLGDVDAARALADQSVRTAAEHHDERLKAHASLFVLGLEEYDNPAGYAERAATEVERLRQVFERHGDDLGLSRAHGRLSEIHAMRGQENDALASTMKAIHHARRAGDDGEERESYWGLVVRTIFGPMPRNEGIELAQDCLYRARGNRVATGVLKLGFSNLLAMGGDFDLARQTATEGTMVLQDLGLSLFLAGNAAWCWASIEILAEDFTAAEKALRPGYEALGRMKDLAFQALLAPVMAEILYAQDRLTEAQEFTDLAESMSSEWVMHQMTWRSTRAKLLARRGYNEQGLHYGHQAASIAQGTDLLDTRGDVFRNLAEVHAIAGRRTDAVASLRQAHQLYEQKGNVVSAAKTLRLLKELTRATSPGEP